MSTRPRMYIPAKNDGDVLAALKVEFSEKPFGGVPYHWWRRYFPQLLAGDLEAAQALRAATPDRPGQAPLSGGWQ